MDKNKEITILGLFTALTIVIANTVGFIPIGPLAVTTMHIPVIIVGILYGKKMGAYMGLIFGLISLIRAYTRPSPTAFIMMNPLVSVLPRLMFGYLTGFLYESLEKIEKKKVKKVLIGVFIGLLAILTFLYFNLDESYRYIFIALGLVLIAGAIFVSKTKDEEGLKIQLATLVSPFFNTFFVLSAIYFIYGGEYVQALSMAVNMIIFTSLANMVMEMAVSSLVCTPIVKILKKEID